jgi:hypothetical protein
LSSAPSPIPSRALPDVPLRGVTGRAILIGLLLIPLNAYWMMMAEMRWYQVLSLNPLFVTPVFFLLGGVIVNALLKRLCPTKAFSPIELATIYIMLAVSCTFATHDYIINLMSTIGWPAWFATPENKWEATMWPHLPHWLFVWDEGALKGYYEGGSTLYRWSNVRPWIMPLGLWIPTILVMVGIMFCLNVLVRKAWIEETKLSFPVVRLPLAMLGADVPRFFSSRLLWIGVTIPVVLGTLNGLHQLYPVVPYFQTRSHLLPRLNPPWSGLYGTYISYYPFQVGLAYFVPVDVAFSCWFFYLFVRFQNVIGIYFGLWRLRGFPYLNEQCIGAWTTYAILLLYLTRSHWKRFPYRWALGGCVIGLVALLWFWRAVGMSIIPSVATIAAYYLLALAITRIRAEAASQHTVWDLEPRYLFGLVDSRLLTRGDFVGGALMHWYWRLNRSHQMPTQLESLKIGDVLGLKPRGLTGALLSATVASALAAVWAYLHIIYREGGTAKCIGFARWTGLEAFNWLQSMLSVGNAFDWHRLVAVLSASGLTLGLWGLQVRSSWLLLHPLGYCAGPWLVWSWFPFMMAWALKSLILRYGGQPAYRRLTPFFLGLILGDYMTGAVWAILGPAMQVQGYQVFH